MAKEPERKSPEIRLAPVHKVSLVPPLPLREEAIEQFRIARPRMPDAGKLAERATPSARAIADGIPSDGTWYLAAICFSQGETTSLSSHISRGGCGPGFDVACGVLGDRTKTEREVWALALRRKARSQRAKREGA
jgi:hypothetical protein